MVLADRGRGFVQIVAAGVADTVMHALGAGFGLLPVIAELSLTAHGLLRFAQGRFMALEAIERCVERTVRERSEAGNADVDADRTALLVTHFLQRQRLVVDEAAHLPLLLAVGHQFVLEGLKSSHSRIIVGSMSNDNGPTSGSATARRVGERRGTAVILRVDAAAMHAAGLRFECSDNGVWLTAHVPPHYLQRVE